MNETMKRLFAPFMALPPARRWLVCGVAGLTMLGFGILIMVSNRTDYKPIFSNLSTEDAGEIVKRLKDQKIPYRLAADGKAVLVPSDKVYDLRLSLASDGLPQGGGIGFEIFDRKNFGMTEFVQKLNYQRALQGELARTILQIAGVEHARVHITIPEKSLFKDNDKSATASVVLRMKPGKSLRESEVQGIVHLVASSVEGLDPEKVTVMNSLGKIVSHAGPSDANGKLTSTMMDAQRTYEKNLEERLQSLLDKAVGSGKSVARVTAQLDFKQVEKVEERYDPSATVVRSEQRSTQNNAAATTPAGVPGVQSNMGKTAPVAATSAGGSKSDETLNYEVSRSSAKIIEPVGTLSRQSVAILVDGKYEPVAPTKSGQPAKPKYQQRTAEEIQQIESLVKGAVGFNAGRGDQVTVVNVPFQDTGDDAAAESPKWWQEPAVTDIGKNALQGLAFLAVLLLVIRPLLKMLTGPKTGQRGGVDQLELDEKQQQLLAGLQGQVPQLGTRIKSPGELVEIVKQDPYQTAQILQNWLSQEK